MSVVEYLFEIQSITSLSPVHAKPRAHLTAWRAGRQAGIGGGRGTQNNEHVWRVWLYLVRLATYIRQRTAIVVGSSGASWHTMQTTRRRRWWQASSRTNMTSQKEIKWQDDRWIVFHAETSVSNSEESLNGGVVGRRVDQCQQLWQHLFEITRNVILWVVEYYHSTEND